MAGLLQYAGQKAIVTLIRAVVSLRVNVGSLPQSWDSILDIPSRQEGRAIKAHVYTPKGATSKASPLPVLLNFHGSGFVMPLHGTDDVYCKFIASSTSYIVIDVPYRLAPEYPFPAAIEDCEDALQYVLAHPEMYDASRVAVSGFSAGGCMALVLASGSGGRVEKGIVKKCAAFYPVVDISQDPAKKMPPQKGGQPIPSWTAKIFDAAYAPLTTTNQRRDSRVSPTFAELNSFCDEIIFFTCGFDNLAPETEELAEKLKRTPGKKITCTRLPKVNHAWDKQAEKEIDGLEKRDRAYEAVAQMLNSGVSQES